MFLLRWVCCLGEAKMAPTVYTAGTLCGAYLIWRRPSPHSSGQPHAPPGLHLHPPGPSNLTTQEMISLHNQGAGKGKEEGCRYVGEVGWRWGCCRAWRNRGLVFSLFFIFEFKHGRMCPQRAEPAPSNCCSHPGAPSHFSPLGSFLFFDLLYLPCSDLC